MNNTTLSHFCFTNFSPCRTILWIPFTDKNVKRSENTRQRA